MTPPARLAEGVSTSKRPGGRVVSRVPGRVSAARSALMRKIRSVSMEERAWRRNLGLRPGTVLGIRIDAVDRTAKTAFFLDGCFWHGCKKHFRLPKTRTEWWRAKIARNVARDRRQSRMLRVAGWRVVRVWSHEVRARDHGRRSQTIPASPKPTKVAMMSKRPSSPIRPRVRYSHANGEAAAAATAIHAHGVTSVRKSEAAIRPKPAARCASLSRSKRGGILPVSRSEIKETIP